ncbi:MAG: carotenoid biosynthesis protein [Crocinitomicaceae bacterium]|nr:carotenoid biosynthesis protein [Crocinitomicaceae bacterium]
MDKVTNIFPIALAVFHVIGATLFIYLSKAPDFSYITIFLSAVLVALSEELNSKSLLLFLVIFCGGFLIELIGVQTGWLFGSYHYNTAMGPLIFGTPVIIGATWYAVVVSSCNWANRMAKHILIRSVLAGALAVLMDVVIEQVALHYELWSWKNDTVPWFNYLCWFVFGSLFSFIYFRYSKGQNRTAHYLYGIWFLFFTILTCVAL